MPTTVVNKHHEAFDVYIGRGSVWGNPFRLAPGADDAARNLVVEQYEEHLLAHPELMARLPELRDKRLGCFCAPKACHGDVLKRYAERTAPAPRFSHALMITGSRTWDDETFMRHSFNNAWRAWGPASVTRPVLLSGRCPSGADAMAESLWRAAGFEVIEFPADWNAQPTTAGFSRNQVMVDALVAMGQAGVQVRAAAFLDLCAKAGCSQQANQQLMPYTPGHFSHGTVHARSRALAAGVVVDDVIHPSLPPF